MRAPINTYASFFGERTTRHQAAGITIRIPPRHLQSHGKTKHFPSKIATLPVGRTVGRLADRY